MKSIKITKTGAYLPEIKKKNEELEKELKLENGYIKKRTGIEERYYLKPEEEQKDIAKKLVKNTLKDDNSVKVIIQNLINKIWFRTDDTYTIEEVQKQIGKEEKEKISKSISENAKETKYSYVTKTFKSTDSNISESISSTYEKDYVFDTKFFTQELETFVALAFLSNGNKIIKPQKLKLIPYFKKGCDDNS